MKQECRIHLRAGIRFGRFEACGWYLCATLHEDVLETWLARRLVGINEDARLVKAFADLGIWGSLMLCLASYSGDAAARGSLRPVGARYVFHFLSIRAERDQRTKA